MKNENKLNPTFSIELTKEELAIIVTTLERNAYQTKELIRAEPDGFLNSVLEMAVTDNKNLAKKIRDFLETKGHDFSEIDDFWRQSQ